MPNLDVLTPPDVVNWLERVQFFAQDQIAPAAASWSMGESPNAEYFHQAAKLNLFGIELPKQQASSSSVEGLGFGFQAKLKACEYLAGADLGFAMSLINTHNVALRLTKNASPELQSKYIPPLLSGQSSACTALTEPGAGSDLAAIECRATQTAKGWSLSGEKKWIVNGRHADLAIVFAKCGTGSGASDIGAFLVDLRSTGAKHYPIDAAFSQTSMGTGGFVLSDVQIPNDHLLLSPGTAFKTILTEINGARTYVAAMCVGMLKTAISQVIKYGDKRITFGKPLSAHAGWCVKLDQASTDLAKACNLIEQAASLIETGDDAQLAAAQAKILAVETCQRHLPELLHLMGAEGLNPDHCFTRHLGAAQVAGLTDGATNLLKERVAKLTGSSSQT